MKPRITYPHLMSPLYSPIDPTDDDKGSRLANRAERRARRYRGPLPEHIAEARTMERHTPNQQEPTE